jgi:mRNA interferase RelE/StbE
MRRIDRVAADPRAPDSNVARLKGRPEMRLRVGDWRVLFVVDDETRQVRILAVAPRGSVYR